MAGKIEHTAPRLKRLLRDAADPVARESTQRFFKEPVRCLGVRGPDIHRTASAAAKEYRQAKLPFERILKVADSLWKPGIVEERILAVLILGKFKRQLERRHWDHFDAWVDSLANWADTDALSGEVFANLLENEPTLAKRLKPWTRGKTRWRRRAAAVTLVRHAKRGDHHDLSFEIIDRLAADRDDMVEKGIGWLLKEISRTQPQVVAAYLIDNIDGLSRTTVRYASEKLPPRLRTKVMMA
jgi:3-methyladenine DNA glycosylase AlkD